jgi:hypothetical protein
MPVGFATALPPVHAFHPATFVERGVAVPFTTPLLMNARGRPGERGGFDLIVPNPSGGRGVYILSWSGVCHICRPTLHDVRLAARLATLPAVSPSEIRRAARAVLAEGLAGREAQSAAAAADVADRHDRLVSNFLLLTLVDQVEPDPDAGLPAARTDAEGFARRARRAVARIAPKVATSADAVAATIEDMAGAFSGIGLPGQTPLPRIPRLLAALRALQEESAAWSRRSKAARTKEAALVAAAAQLTLMCATHALSAAHGFTTDMVDLLRQWSLAPRAVAARLARPEWLLDGWEPICALWTSAVTDWQRIEVLTEIAAMIPVLPREAAAWMDVEIDTESIIRFRKTVLLNQDWRTGEMFDLIARNEHLRALAA